MNYREQIYKNALRAIENIYRESQYSEEVDLYRSYDIMNSINESQMSSKQWLVENIIKFLKPENLRDGPIRDVIVLGGWYGITGMLLRQHLNHEVKIWNIDSESLCEKYGYILQHGNPNLEHNYFITDDALSYYFDRTDAFQLIINTSCEHMEQDDIKLILNVKPKDTIVCFQSNNYHSVQSHINTHNSLEEFVDSLDLTRVWYAEKYSPNNDYERYMVIGI
jgi:hypothetical protein